MKQIKLSPNQIIALNDSHIYSQEALKKYFEMFKANSKPVAFCPVIKKTLGIPFSKGKDLKSKEYNKKFEAFINKHPHAEYFLLDGNHKTTASALMHQKINAILIEKDSDFNEIEKLGKKFGWYKICTSVKDALNELSKNLFEYYSDDFGFSTVEEKTKKLIKNKEIPEEIL